MRPLSLTVLLLALLVSPVRAENFCVDDPDGLQQVLSTAASNQQDDNIRIVRGRYSVSQVVFSDAEPFALALSGGWDSECLTADSDPSLTTLAAKEPGAALLVFSSGAAVSTSIKGLTFYGGFLRFNRSATVTMSGVNIVAADRDGDGVDDPEDAFPDDPQEQYDTDDDGIGNNEDADDDNDRMPDSFEINNGLNPLVDDADQDLDVDGYTNFEEFELGTAPNDPQDVPASTPSWLLLLPAIIDK